MSELRSCSCGHDLPICCCCEGLAGDALIARSRKLSSIAGWPAAIDDDQAVAVLAEFGRPVWVNGNPPSWPWPPLDAVPMALAGRQVVATVGGEGADCGCGSGLA
jgi:hypothetical protein